MDDKPFLEFSFESFNENLVHELKKFQKSQFNVENIVHSASDLKYSKQIRDVLSQELKDPSEEFVRFFASKVYNGRLTQKVIEQFTDLVKKSAKNLISEMISERLQTALDKEKDAYAEQPQEEETEASEEEKKGIVTTQEEIDGFNIVKSILRKVVNLDRVNERDTKSYFNILLDDTNRQPICRLHFNGKTKYLGVFDENKKEERIKIETLNDIFNYSDKITRMIAVYDGNKDESK
jgi:hypothetical protein